MAFSETITISQLAHILMLVFAVYVLIQTILQRSINAKSNRFIVYLMIQFTVIATISLMSTFSNSFSKYFIFIYIPAFLFLSPSTYLYIKSLTTKDYLFSAKDKLHYLFPLVVLIAMFVVNMLLLILHFNKNIGATLKLVDIYYYMNVVIILVVPVFQLFYYSILIIKSYKRHLKEIENYFSNTDEAKMLWIRWFIIVFVLFMIVFNFVNFDLGKNSNITDIFYYGEILVFIGFLGVFGIKQADIYRLVNMTNVPKNESSDSIKGVLNQKEESFTQSQAVNSINPIKTVFSNASTFVLGQDKKEELKNQLLATMHSEKPYLNATLTITDLAELINTNQKYLSVVINDCFHKNFFVFVNEYRVNEAIDLLKTDKGQQYSIEGIGKTVGFNSRSTFITAFKKQTQLTPSEYKNRVN